MYRSGLYHDPGKKRQRCEKGSKPCEKITAKKQIRYFFRGDIIEKVWLSCHQAMEKLCDRVPSARQETIQCLHWRPTLGMAFERVGGAIFEL